MTKNFRNRALCGGLMSLAFVLVANPAIAQNSTPAEQSEENDAADDIVVTGARTFLSVDTSGTTGLPLPIEKVPQSISLVNGDFLRAADLKNIGQVADYTAGAVNAGSNGNLASRIKLRGFAGGKAIDGLTVYENFDPDYATVERLEVVKGPSSVIYGSSFAGGIVNRVTKSAKPGTPSYISLQGGSFNRFRAEAQVASSLDSDDRVRVIGVAVAARGDSFQDVMKSRDYVVYLGVNADISDNVTGYIHAGYEEHTRTSFDGIPTYADGSPAPVPRSFFIGSARDPLKSKMIHANGDLTWHATDMLEFSLKGQVEEHTLRGTLAYGYNLRANGDISLASSVYLPIRQTSYGVGVTSLYKLDNLGLTDSFITVAALYQGLRERVAQTRGLFGTSFTGTSNINLGVRAISAAIDAGVQSAAVYNRNTDTHQLTLSAQSVLKPIDSVSVLLGASYSKAAVDYDLFGNLQNFDPKARMSYRAGLTWEFVKNANVYASFSQSFNPQLFRDVNGIVLPPVVGDQYEVGVKYRTFGGKLLLTAAAYEIKQKNQGRFDQTLAGTDRYRAVGELTHKGIELEALGNLTKEWQVSLGFAHMDPKVTKDTNLVALGKTETFLPKDTFSLFSTYTVGSGGLEGFTFGGGARFVGKQLTSYTGATLPLPSYTVFDGTVGYSFDKWSIQANIRNLTDKRYYINNYDTLVYGNMFGTPRSIMVTVGRNF